VVMSGERPEGLDSGEGAQERERDTGLEGGKGHAVGSTRVLRHEDWLAVDVGWEEGLGARFSKSAKRAALRSSFLTLRELLNSAISRLLHSEASALRLARVSL